MTKGSIYIQIRSILLLVLLHLGHVKRKRAKNEVK